MTKPSEEQLDLGLSAAQRRAVEAIEHEGMQTRADLVAAGSTQEAIDSLITLGVLEEVWGDQVGLCPPSPALQILAAGAPVSVFEGQRLLFIEPVVFVGEEVVGIKRGSRVRRFMVRGGWLLEWGRAGGRFIRPATEADFQHLELRRCTSRLERCDWRRVSLDTLKAIVRLIEDQEAA